MWVLRASLVLCPLAFQLSFLPWKSSSQFLALSLLLVTLTSYVKDAYPASLPYRGKG